MRRSLLFREQHGFGGGGAAVDTDEAFHHFARLEGGRDEFLGAVFLFEARQIVGVLGQAAGAAALLFFFFAADVDVPFQLVEADVLADFVVFGLAEFDGADGGEVLRVIGRA